MANIYPDANFLINLTRASHQDNVGTAYLDLIFGDPNDSVIVTDTVLQEVRNNLNAIDTRVHDIFSRWIDLRTATDIEIAYTLIPVGRNQGEYSIIEQINSDTIYNPPDDGLVRILSSDYGYNWGDVIDSNTVSVHTSIDAMNNLFLSGSFSYIEYDAAVKSLESFVPVTDQFYATEEYAFYPRRFVEGVTYTIEAPEGESYTNYTMRIVPGGVVVITDEQGTVTTIAQTERFHTVLENGITKIEILDDNRFCFSAGTQIDLGDRSRLPIESIEVGGGVAAFGGFGVLGKDVVVRKVVQKSNYVAHDTIDFHGTVVTPGHVFLSGDNSFKKLADILEEDGTVVWEDGTVLRARTKYPVGSAEDRIISVGYDDPETGETVRVPMRAGVPFGMKDGAPVTLLAFMKMQGYELGSDGLFINIDGETAIPHWDWGVPPDQFVAERPVSFA